MTIAPRKKKNQPPKTKDVFKLFRWYKKKWDRQAKEDERERKKQERADRSQAKVLKLTTKRKASDKNHIRKLRAIDRRSAKAAQKHATFLERELRKLRKLNNKLKRMLDKE